MLSIPFTFNKITDYVNKAVDRVFIDNNKLIALDPRKESIDKDPRIKAVKGRVIINILSFEFSVWIILKYCSTTRVFSLNSVNKNILFSLCFQKKFQK